MVQNVQFSECLVRGLTMMFGCNFGITMFVARTKYCRFDCGVSWFVSGGIEREQMYYVGGIERVSAEKMYYVVNEKKLLKWRNFHRTIERI